MLLGSSLILLGWAACWNLDLKTGVKADNLVFIPMFRTMRSRDRDVILVRRTIDLGCWEFGMGREWGGDGEGEDSGRETDRELARGVKKGNCAITYIVNLYMCI
jgi:hypothetical protein